MKCKKEALQIDVQASFLLKFLYFGFITHIYDKSELNNITKDEITNLLTEIGLR